MAGTLHRWIDVVLPMGPGQNIRVHVAAGGATGRRAMNDIGRGLDNALDAAFRELARSAEDYARDNPKFTPRSGTTQEAIKGVKDKYLGDHRFYLTYDLAAYAGKSTMVRGDERRTKVGTPAWRSDPNRGHHADWMNYPYGGVLEATRDGQRYRGGRYVAFSRPFDTLQSAMEYYVQGHGTGSKATAVIRKHVNRKGGS